MVTCSTFEELILKTKFYSGTVGRTGLQGPTGKKGEKGLDGPQGPKGDPGKHGQNGSPATCFYCLAEKNETSPGEYWLPPQISSRILSLFNQNFIE